MFAPLRLYHHLRHALSSGPASQRSLPQSGGTDPSLASVFGACAGGGYAALWADDPHEQIRHYRHWVYAAVRAIASRVAGTPLTLSRTDTGEPLDEDHPLPRLLAEVNPFDTAVTLWNRTVTSLELTGNAYWYVPRNALGAPAEIWLLPAQYMRVIPDARRFVGGYLFQNAGVEQRFDAAEVIHLKYPSPASVYYGAGALQAAAGAVDAHESIKEAERRSFRNGIFPGLAVQTGEKLASDVRRRLEEALKRGFAGPERAGRALILEQGLTVRPFTFSPREMDFLQSAKVTRDEILAIFGVPAAVAGLSEDVNRASAEAMIYTFAENTIQPKLRLLEAQITQDLCRAFDPRIRATFESPLPRVRAEERADMIARLRFGVTSVNEERRRIGLRPVADGDLLRIETAKRLDAAPSRSERQDPQPLAPQTDPAAPGRPQPSAKEASPSVPDPIRAAARGVMRGLQRRIRDALEKADSSAAGAVAAALDDPGEADRLAAPLTDAAMKSGDGQPRDGARASARSFGAVAAARILLRARRVLVAGEDPVFPAREEAPGDAADRLERAFGEALTPRVLDDIAQLRSARSSE